MNLMFSIVFGWISLPPRYWLLFVKSFRVAEDGWDFAERLRFCSCEGRGQPAGTVWGRGNFPKTLLAVFLIFFVLINCHIKITSHKSSEKFRTNCLEIPSYLRYPKILQDTPKGSNFPNCEQKKPTAKGHYFSATATPQKKHLVTNKPTQPVQVIPTSHPCHVLSITFILPPPSSGPSLGSLQPGSRGAQMALSDLDRCIFRQRSGDSSTSNTQRNRKCGRTTTIGNKYSEVVKQKMNEHDTWLSLGLRKYEYLSFHPNQQGTTSHGRCWHSLSRDQKDIGCCCQLQGGAWYLPQGGCSPSVFWDQHLFS